MTIAIERMLADPGPEVELATGEVTRVVRWGHPWQIGTAAYWIAATREAGRSGEGRASHRLGIDLREEIAACLLGGFGMPFETGLAAFEAVRDHLMRARRKLTVGAIEEILREPLAVGQKARMYRFPHQRATRLAGALAWVDSHSTSIPTDGRELRDWLLDAPGIGLKTASWIVRNQLDSGDVAVLDVHVMRAGIRSRVFPVGATVARDYRPLEALFLAWAHRGDVSAADLDAVIWAEQAYWARHPGPDRSPSHTG